jgi:hypothetical protein
VTFGNTTLEHAFLNVLKVYDVARRHLLSCGGPESEGQDVYPNLVREKRTLLARGASGPLQGGLHLAEYFVSIIQRNKVWTMDILNWLTDCNSMATTVYPTFLKQIQSSKPTWSTLTRHYQSYPHMHVKPFSKSLLLNHRTL